MQEPICQTKWKLQTAAEDILTLLLGGSAARGFKFKHMNSEVLKLCRQGPRYVTTQLEIEFNARFTEIVFDEWFGVYFALAVR